MAYTFDNLKSRINSGIKGKIGVLVSAEDTLNQVVREVISDVDLRSTIRQAQLTPSLFTNIFEYACPTDMKGQALINIKPQADKKNIDYDLTTAEEFMIDRHYNKVAFKDNDLIRKIMVNAVVNDKQVVIDRLDTVGGWTAFGDGENLEADTHNFVRDSASLKFDIDSAGGTTAGIENTGLATFDLTDFLGVSGAVFVWAYITSTTNLTNFILRIGSSSSNYYQKTTTTQSDGTAFKTGWNLLRFDLTSLTIEGAPDNDAGAYVAIYMTKDAAKVDEDDYAFDNIILKKGEINEVVYYSKFGWRTSAGTYIENSTAISDLLQADTDEFDLFVAKGIEIAGLEVDEVEASDRAARKYIEKRLRYQQTNPSRAKNIIQEYANFTNTD